MKRPPRSMVGAMAKTVARSASPADAKIAILAGANVLATAFDFFDELEGGSEVGEAAKRAWRRAKKRTAAVQHVEEQEDAFDRMTGKRR